MKLLVSIYNLLGNLLLRPLLSFELRKRKSPAVNERPAEYAFSLHQIQQYCKGHILDIGPGISSWPHLLYNCGYKIKAIDRIDGYWGSFFNRHFKITKDDITNPKTQEKYQFITCLSVLEHIPDHRAALKNMYNLLEDGGYLILSFPYNEQQYHSNIYKHPKAGYGQNSKFITQVYSRNEINQWLGDSSFKILEQEYYQIFTGELWTFGEVICPTLKTTNDRLHHLTCMLMQKAN
jgi:trans-aconitate methyltransferase